MQTRPHPFSFWFTTNWLHKSYIYVLNYWHFDTDVTEKQEIYFSVEKKKKKKKEKKKRKKLNKKKKGKEITLYNLKANSLISNTYFDLF